MSLLLMLSLVLFFRLLLVLLLVALSLIAWLTMASSLMALDFPDFPKNRFLQKFKNIFWLPVSILTGSLSFNT